MKLLSTVVFQVGIVSTVILGGVVYMYVHHILVPGVKTFSVGRRKTFRCLSRHRREYIASQWAACRRRMRPAVRALIGKRELLLLVPLFHNWILLNLVEVIPVCEKDVLQDSQVERGVYAVATILVAPALQRGLVVRNSGKALLNLFLYELQH